MEDIISKKNGPGVYVFDMDEVLVDISPSAYRAVRFNWRKYHRFFKDLGPLTDEQILDRDEFYMIDWLIKSKYKLLPEDEFNHTLKIVKDMLNKDYFEYSDIYQNLEPTTFARGTLMNKAFIEHSNVKKVYILTRYVSDKMLDGKKKFIKKYFNNPKVEVIYVPLGVKKSDYIKEKNINWDLYVDDEISNIADFAENLDINGKEFLIPKLGYNSMPLHLDLLIKEKGAVYNYYKRV
jgi:hypothetical protein